MRNPMNKRIPRMLLHQPAHYVPLFLLLLITIIFCSAFFLVQGSVERLYYDFMDRSHVEDGRFTTLSPLSNSTWKRLEEKGVRLEKSYYAEAKDGNADVHLYAMREKINLPDVIAGRMPEKDDEVALDVNYAGEHAYTIGQDVTLSGHKMHLVGTVVLPDYIAMMRNRADLVMDTKNFGVGIVSADGLSHFDRQGLQYTYSYRENKTSTTKKEANDTLKELTKTVYEDNILTEAMTKAQNKRISYMMDDMGGDVPMMQTVLVLAVLSIAFVFTMQTRNQIISESSAIGTLMASGYTRRELIAHYMLLPTIAVFSAAVLGNFITYQVGYKLYLNLYYASFSLPVFHPLFNARAFLLTTVIPATIVMLIQFLMLMTKLRLRPLRFLRHELGRKPRVSKMRFSRFAFFSRLGFLSRYRLKVLFNNKLNVLVLLFGVTLSSVFLCFGLGMRPIFERHATLMQKEFPAKVQTFVRPGAVLGAADEKAEKFGYAAFDLSINGDVHPFALYGVAPHSRYFDAEAIDPLQDKEIQASEGLMKRFGLAEGDNITVVNPYTGKKYTFCIRAMRRQAVTLSAYMPLPAFNAVMGYDKEAFSGYYSEEKLHLDPAYVASCIDLDTVGKASDHFLDTFGQIIGPIVFIAVLFYFIFIDFLSKAIVDKAKTEIAYLKIFGFTDTETTGIYLRATGILLSLFLLVLPFILRSAMAVLLTASLAKLDSYMDPHLSMHIYFLVSVTGAVLFFLVQALQKRKIAKISMTETLKEV